MSVSQEHRPGDRFEEEVQRRLAEENAERKKNTKKTIRRLAAVAVTAAAVTSAGIVGFNAGGSNDAEAKQQPVATAPANPADSVSQLPPATSLESSPFPDLNKNNFPYPGEGQGVQTYEEFVASREILASEFDNPNDILRAVQDQLNFASCVGGDAVTRSTYDGYIPATPGVASGVAGVEADYTIPAIGEAIAPNNPDFVEKLINSNGTCISYGEQFQGTSVDYKAEYKLIPNAGSTRAVEDGEPLLGYSATEIYSDNDPSLPEGTSTQSTNVYITFVQAPSIVNGEPKWVIENWVEQ